MNRNSERREHDTTSATDENAFARDYQVIGRIGGGGDGTVFLVRHEATGQLRASKEFRRDTQASRMRELQMLRHLKHPSLPGVFDILEDGERCWLVMEYIDGWSLQTFRKCKPEAEQFFDSMDQLLAAVAYLHAQSPPVLHLDLKPTNLLVDRTGHLYVIDFGASIRLMQENGTNPCVGTPGFAAPEQLDPEARVDGRADLYGCGAVMYWYLYGQIPLRADSGAVQRPEASGRLPAWEKDVGRIIRRCLQTEITKRFSDIEELQCSFERAKRLYSRRQHWKMDICAVMFLVVFLLFSAHALLAERKNEKLTAAQEYEQQLQISEKFGISQAEQCYEAAAQLCPENFFWCLHLIERVSADYCFETEEELVLKNLLYTVPVGETETYVKLLEADPVTFSKFCYLTGVAYWYFYEGSGGKRAAVSWFSNVIDAPMQNVDWCKSAEIHAKIGSYYEQLNYPNMQGEQEIAYGIYWMDLCTLWNLEYFDAEAVEVRRQVAGELLAGVLLRAHELKKYGVEYKQIEEILTGIEAFQKKTGKKELHGQCEAAREAAVRVWMEEENTESEGLGEKEEMEEEELQE